MTTFYFSAFGLIVFAALFVLYPIIGNMLTKKRKERLFLSNANVIKQRITELERELEEGLINPDDKELAIRDLKLALVEETPENSADLHKEQSSELNSELNKSQNVLQNEDSRHSTVSSKKSYLVYIALFVPCIALGAWVYWQSNQLKGLQEYKQAQVDVEEIRTRMQSEGAQSLLPNDYAKLALSIRRKLRETPEDDAGWAFLGQINVAIGRMEEGVAALRKSLDINPQNNDVRFKYAEALMLSADEESLGNAKRQLLYLVSQAPEDRNYRLLLTATAIQLQDAELALANFNIIKDEINPESQFYQSLISGLRGMGVDVLPTAQELNKDTPTQATMGNLSNTELSTDTRIDSHHSIIDVHIDLSRALQSKLPETGYLIVFAQDAKSGSRAPLAVKRISLPSFPVNVRLSDADAMIPAMNLSSAKLINISARVSADAVVMPKAGELEGGVFQLNLEEQQNVNEAIKVKVMIDKEL